MANQINLANESLFIHTFHHAGFGLGLVSLQGKWLKVNPSLCRITGYLEEELLKLHFQDITHPDDLDRELLYLNQLLQGETKTYQMEKRYNHKDGSLIWVQLQVSLVRDEFANPLFFVADIQDITKRKNAERSLLESNQRYKSLFEHHPDIVYSISNEGELYKINSACEKVTGYSPFELIGQNASILIPSDKERFMHHLELAFKGLPQDYEIRIVHKKGHTVPLRMTKFPIIVDHQIIGVYGIAKDVTEYKRKGEELRNMKKFYSRIVEESPDAVVISQNDQWIYVNETGVKLLGCQSKEEALSKPFLDYISPEFRTVKKDRLRRVTLGETAELMEQKLVRADGKILHVDTISIPTIYKGKPAIHTIIRDITERQKTRELLLRSEKLSVAGQLSAGIAHEIRNPLTAIKGFLQLMKSGQPAKQEYLDVISEELNRIEDILSELLLLAKPQALKREVLDIRNLLEQMITLLGPQAILKNIDVEAEFASGLPNITADENQLKQIFINFIKNAMESMPDGGLIRVRALAEQPSFVHILIIDNGCGIPEEQLARLGEPFYTTKEKGTGLGLMVSRKIIEEHGGSLFIHSKINEGTTIEVKLPV
jgi:two-component system, sporulation sensor kinase A